MNRVPILLLAAAALWTQVVAQPMPKGGEFQVNTYTPGGQFPGAVASDAAGNFVVAWSSYPQDGSSFGVFGQRFDSVGAPLAGEFQINTYTTNSQVLPDVAMDSSGSFVVTWESVGQDGSGYGIFGQRFDSAGTPVAGEFQVNTQTTADQIRPAVSMDPFGGFVVVWQDDNTERVVGRLYDNAGMSPGGEFEVATFTNPPLLATGGPAVAVAPSGDFLVTWETFGEDGSSWGVFGRFYDGTGAPLGAAFPINTYTTQEQFQPALATDPNGNFVVVWTSEGQDGQGQGIFGQRYDGTGGVLGGEFQVNTSTLVNQRFPQVGVVDLSGGFVVVWQGDDGSGWGVLGQQFDAGGSQVGPEFQVNTFTTSDQMYPAVGSDPLGRFVVVWHSAGQDDPPYGGTFGQRYCADVDTDADGTLDCDDLCPLDPDKITPGTCGCGNPDDFDMDGVLDCEGDCDPLNGVVWGSPGEVESLTVSHDPLSGTTTLAWNQPAVSGGNSPLAYDTIRSSVAGDFVTSATCVESDDAGDLLSATSDSPPMEGVHFFLIRAENDCPGAVGMGPLGTDYLGMPRTARSCP